MKKTVWIFLSLFLFLCFPVAFPSAGEQDNQEQLKRQYEEYQNRLRSIRTRSQMDSGGFQVIEDQVFPMETKAWGEVLLIPAMDRRYGRLVLFLAKDDQTVIYYTDQLETNNQIRGSLAQPNKGIAAVSFQELDGGGVTEVVLITVCEKEDGNTYKVGDVLFQNEKGFYRDWRLSDKVNRYHMNKSALFIVSFVKEGYSTEFLYTATTQKELLEHGFDVWEGETRWVNFEKMGRLKVVPGTYKMAEYTVYMIYLVNEQGYIVWSFQPMGDYENLFEAKGIVCEDIDGDGLTDLMALSSYSKEGSAGEMLVSSDYSVYYQRTGGFYTDWNYKRQHPCREEDTLDQLVKQARAYWGWGADG